jgi:uncharacterized protein YndB with AHSA1/START domain
MKPTDEPVVVEQTFNVPVEDVWNAITEAARMQQWFFSEMNEFEPTVGFETQFDVECEGKHYLHLWKITEVIPQQRIVYDWRYEGWPGQGLVVWEVEATSDGAKLTLTNTAVEAFPEDDPNFSRESGEAGWQYFINDRLPSYLTK